MPSEKPPVAQMAALSTQLQSEVAALYYRLGGRDPLPVRTGPWDMTFGDLVVEYDEEQHFNRYRQLTFDTPFATELPWRTAYLAQCATYEYACRNKASNRGFWTNTPTERMFGPPGVPGELNGPGSPRWKQRAIYDIMRDALAFNGTVRLVRLSRWDEVDDVPLWQSLNGIQQIDRDALVALVEARVIG